jgi:hypothetical protein
MTKPPTDTQRAILRAAAAHPRGLAAPPAHLRPAPRIAVAKALLGAGLLARAQGDEGQRPGLSWKLDGEAVLLRITAAGLQAVGAAPEAASPEPQQGAAAEPAGQAAAPVQDGAAAAAEPGDAAQATAPSEAGAPQKHGRGRPDGRPSAAPRWRCSSLGRARLASST